MSKLLMIAAWAAAFSAFPAYSADVIRGYHEPEAARRTVHIAGIEECTRLQIDYRLPYTPRTDFVNHCDQRFDLTPAGVRGSTGAIPISTGSYSVQ